MAPSKKLNVQLTQMLPSALVLCLFVWYIVVTKARGERFGTFLPLSHWITPIIVVPLALTVSFVGSAWISADKMYDTSDDKIDEISSIVVGMQILLLFIWCALAIVGRMYDRISSKATGGTATSGLNLALLYVVAVAQLAIFSMQIAVAAK